MRSHLGRKLAVAAALVGATSLVPGTAWADGAQTPSGAPTVSVGITYFGDTRIPDSSPMQDYYRLPPLMAGDVVTVATKTTLGQFDYVDVCLAGDVDDFSWVAAGCNLAADQRVGAAGSRLQFRALFATSSGYLRFFRRSAINRTSYQFTVEKIQHQLSLRISAGAETPVDGKIAVQTVLTNGRGVADGHPLTLAVVVDGRTYTYRSTAKGGKAVFQLGLPSSAAGKEARLNASSSSSSTIYTGASATRTIDVVK